MKKNLSAVSIILAFMCGVPWLYATTEGHAVISSALGPGTIAIDEKIGNSSYPVDIKLVIENTETGKQTEVTVAKIFPNSDKLAEIAKDVADIIGIQGEGRITLRTLPEAEAYGHSAHATQKILASQDSDTMPPKSDVLPPTSGTGSGGNQTAPSPAPEPAALAGDPQPEPVKEQTLENAEAPMVAKADVNPPPNPPQSNLRNSEPKIENRPVLDSPMKPEIAVPSATQTALQGKETLKIQEQPSIDPSLSAEASSSDNPEIAVPSATQTALQGKETLKIQEQPSIDPSLSAEASSLDNPEIALPSATQTALQGKETLKIQEEPGVAPSLATEDSKPLESPEIALPAITQGAVQGKEPVKIQDTPSVTAFINPEIYLPAENPSAPKVRDRSPVEKTPKEKSPEKSQNWDENTQLALVPSENRPPAERTPLSGLPAEAEIAPITRNTTAPAGSPRLPPEAEIAPITRNTAPPAGLPPEAEIAPITRTAGSSGTEERGSITRNTTPLPTVAPRIPPEGDKSRDPISIMTGLPPEAEIPAISQAPKPPVFSVPMVTTLEKGKYYVQLAALSRSELVELELSKIGKSYPLTIQTIWNQDKPIYRILLGPMNQGESGALLQRFKGIGYSDAFVRQGT